MNAYMYQADLHCEDCNIKIKIGLCFPKCGIPLDESTYDSDDYPKGPYPDGGGEADTPQHCGSCGLFLKNPLTCAGGDYVKESVRESFARYQLNPDMGKDTALEYWKPFYSYLFED